MKNLAIITGGNSAEQEISIASSKQVISSIDKNKYNAIIIEIKNNNWNAIFNENKIQINKKDFTLVVDSKKIIFHYVFMALHGRPAENGKIQQYFDELNIPYSCCGAKISAITFNKSTCNKELRKLGFNCPKSISYKINEDYNVKDIVENIGLPCFIKPNESGSSFGISKVKTENQISKAISTALSFDNSFIIEEFIDGIEVSCSVFKINNKIDTLPITEIVSHNEFFDYDAKYNGLSEEITPARIDTKISSKVKEISKEIYRKINLRGVCRIDYIIMNDIVYIIEINTIPGLSKESIVPKQIKTANISLSVFFNNWIESTLNK